MEANILLKMIKNESNELTGTVRAGRGINSYDFLF